jgi:hypothetical protein
MSNLKKLNKFFESFNIKAVIGVILLIASFIMGIILRNSAYITNVATRRFSTCDTYISWLCIPTEYIHIPLGVSVWLVINLTSFLVSVILFILGVLLLRSRKAECKR